MTTTGRLPRAVLFLASALIAACELIGTEPEALPAKPTPPVQSGTVADIPWEPWMGPKPTAAPIVPVNSATLAPLPGATVEADHPEPDGVGGITSVHAQILKVRGREGLIWSPELSDRARLLALQSKPSLCGRSTPMVQDAPGEVVWAHPAGRSASGESRLARLTVRQAVQQWSARDMGVFRSDARHAGALGCSRQICEDQSQILMCVYR